MTKRGKLKWIVENFFTDPERVMKELTSYWLLDDEKQRILDQFSENTISNFYLPYGVAPNFIINKHTYCIPMVTEESSVVAAASHAAKYWSTRGGFKAEVISTDKVGHIHFIWTGKMALIEERFNDLKREMWERTSDITQSMVNRGGGIRDIKLVNLTSKEADTYQIKVVFNTADSMGANFMNTVLEALSNILRGFFQEDQTLSKSGDFEVIMAILSNYTPDCLVRAEVSCPIEDLGITESMTPRQFADRFHKAVRIAHVDPYRAATHNKGIFNGIDAVVMATANDLRAVEANGHVYAARNGQYASLTDCTLHADIFKFWIEIPLALGTVGGLTSLHPMAKRSLELLGGPSSEELMMVVASMGLAQNFAAIRSLVTTGIQKGHMRMHLNNMLIHLQATEHEVKEAMIHFKDKVVSFAAVREFLELFRGQENPVGGHKI